MALAKIKNLSAAVGLVTVCIMSAVLYSNCTAGFSVEAQRKSDFLESNSLFGRTNSSSGGTGDGQGDQEICMVNGDRIPCPTPTATPAPPDQPVEPPAPVKVEIETDLYCSWEGSNKTGDTLKKAPSALQYAFEDDAGSTKCSFTEMNAREKIINTGKISFDDLASKCPSLTTGNYILKMARAGASKSLLTSIYLSGNDSQDAARWFGNPLKVKVEKSGQTARLTVLDAPPCETPGGKIWSEKLGLVVCQDLYGKLSAKVLYDTAPLPLSGEVKDSMCTAASSPLVIQIPEAGSGNSVIRLTSPLEGISFKIKGINSYPTANSKQQISWLDQRSSLSNYFLALPNRDGEIVGIDQLFGDNTVGPDGKTAANGYAALAKFDGRVSADHTDEKFKDGRIDKNDEIFGELRLWGDFNRDGIAQREELFTLDQKAISSIDLNFDPNFSETDQYGNEIKMKSVATSHNGSLFLIYDLWFRTL